MEYVEFNGLKEPIALVVDDEPFILTETADTIAGAGFFGIEASTSDKAFEFLTTHSSLRLLSATFRCRSIRMCSSSPQGRRALAAPLPRDSLPHSRSFQADIHPHQMSFGSERAPVEIPDAGWRDHQETGLATLPRPWWRLFTQTRTIISCSALPYINNDHCRHQSSSAMVKRVTSRAVCDQSRASPPPRHADDHRARMLRLR